ncbi:MAG TPA: DUF924 family protein [Burkholderiaceae bacterium]
MQTDSAAVLDFWFTPGLDETPGTPRGVWFKKDERFDAVIRQRFGALIERALADGLREWDAQGASGTLARILVLDQFTRNTGRDTPRAFAGDAMALEAARKLVDNGLDRTMPSLQRWFAYMPFEHAEDIEMQDKAVALFEALAQDMPQLAGALDYAIRHRDVIARFGRFPHRNEILGRTSTEEEIAFLKTPGSRF